MKKRRILSVFLSLFSLSAMVSCGTTQNETPPIDDDFTDSDNDSGNASIVLNGYTGDNYTFDTTSTNENGSVSYEIFVRSFYDSNSDGIGDFNGITYQLDYLEDLGIKTLWLMPIMPSPTYHGYDVSDYYDVNSDYGSMADFENLISSAKDHNIDIMIDIVFNHSSTQHPWFAQSYQDYITNNTAADSKADWYCWSNTHRTGYSIYANSSVYYESRFDYTMPDFNTTNQAVKDEMVSILDFWATKGVKGFRFDAVKYFDYNNTAYNTQFLTYLHDETVKTHPGTYFVGECWDTNDVVLNYYNSSFESFFKFKSSLDGNASDTFLSVVKGLSTASSFASSIQAYEAEVKNKNENAYSSYFLSNHDMDRSSNNLTGDYAKMAASLVYLMPGTPFMYYGEEILLKGKRNTSPDDLSDARRRLPMIWSQSSTTGLCNFPEAKRTDLYTNQQVILGVTDQLNSGYSVLNHYKKVINIRNKYPFIKNSVFTNKTSELNTTYRSVFAYELSYGDESIIVIQNCHAINIELDVSSLGSSILDEVSCSKLTPELKNGKLKIGSFSTVIIK